MTRNHHTQSGNVFFIILLAISMFAALSYAVMKGSQSGATGTLTKDKARFAATEILSYSDTLAKGVQTLRLRGCSDTQMNFYTNAWALGLGTTPNSTAPADKSCNLFDVEGAKTAPPTVDPSWGNGTTSGHRWYITKDNTIAGIGTSAADLAIVLRNVDLNVCLTINTILGINNPNNLPPLKGILDPGTAFTGTYNASPYSITHASLDGKTAFCLTDNNEHKFFRVLILR